MAASWVEAVKRYAVEHYEEGGWDFVVECWEDKDIEERTAGCATAEEAIKKVGHLVGIVNEQRVESWVLGGLCRRCGRLHEDGKENCDG